MIIGDFIDELARRLRDVEKRQWSQDVLVDALNSAFGALCQSVPDAHVVHRTIDLVEGATQRIPSDCDKLVRLLHNVVDGKSTGVIRQADMGAMDATVPNWRSDEQGGSVRHWFADQMEDDVFYVWPPAPAPASELEPPVSEVVGSSVRATLIQVPGVVDQALAPVVPDEPVAPVDPGAIGDGGDIAPGGLYNSVVTDTRRITPIKIPPLPPVVSLSGSVVDVRLPDDLSGMSGAVQFNKLAYDVYGSGGDLSNVTDQGVPFAWADSRLVAGAVIRFDIAGATTVVDVDLYSPGTTQEEIDAYQTALTQYNAALDAYNAAVAALAAFNASNLVITDPLPFDRVFINPLFEYSMYYCYGIDDEASPNTARSNRHLIAFYQLLNKEEAAKQIIETARAGDEP